MAWSALCRAAAPRLGGAILVKAHGEFSPSRDSCVSLTTEEPFRRCHLQNVELANIFPPGCDSRLRLM